LGSLVFHNRGANVQEYAENHQDLVDRYRFVTVCLKTDLTVINYQNESSCHYVVPGSGSIRMITLEDLFQRNITKTSSVNRRLCLCSISDCRDAG